MNQVRSNVLFNDKKRQLWDAEWRASAAVTKCRARRQSLRTEGVANSRNEAAKGQPHRLPAASARSTMEVIWQKAKSRFARKTQQSKARKADHLSCVGTPAAGLSDDAVRDIEGFPNPPTPKLARSIGFSA